MKFGIGQEVRSKITPNAPVGTIQFAETRDSNNPKVIYFVAFPGYEGDRFSGNGLASWMWEDELRPATGAQCRTCRMEMTWVQSEQGAKLPLCRDPHPEGNIYINDMGIGVYCYTGCQEGKPLYLNHFANCPQSKEHRRAKSTAKKPKQESLL